MTDHPMPQLRGKAGMPSPMIMMDEDKINALILADMREVWEEHDANERKKAAKKMEAARIKRRREERTEYILVPVCAFLMVVMTVAGATLLAWVPPAAILPNLGMIIVRKWTEAKFKDMGDDQ